MTFPNTPTDGQLFEVDGRNFYYSEEHGAWRCSPFVGPVISTQIIEQLTVYPTLADLPASSNLPVEFVFIDDTNTLYLWDGVGWIDYEVLNLDPVITSVIDPTYELSAEGTPIVFELEAYDPEGFNLTWSYEITRGALTDQYTVQQVNNVITVTPAVNAYDNEFDITFSVTDGSLITSKTATFSLVNKNPVVETIIEDSYYLRYYHTVDFDFVSEDPEGQPVTWTYTTSEIPTTNGVPNATVTQNGSFFSIANNPNYSDLYDFSFDVTFSVTDGVKTTELRTTINYLRPPDVVPPGQMEWVSDGVYQFTVPEWVLSISALTLGAGGGGGYSCMWADYVTTYGWAGGGGGGGGLSYQNDIPVMPGEVLTIEVGKGTRPTSDHQYHYGYTDNRDLYDDPDWGYPEYWSGNTYIYRGEDILLHAGGGQHGISDYQGQYRVLSGYTRYRALPGLGGTALGYDGGGNGGYGGYNFAGSNSENSSYNDLPDNFYGIGGGGGGGAGGYGSDAWGGSGGNGGHGGATGSDANNGSSSYYGGGGGGSGAYVTSTGGGVGIYGNTDPPTNGTGGVRYTMPTGGSGGDSGTRMTTTPVTPNGAGGFGRSGIARWYYDYYGNIVIPYGGDYCYQGKTGGDGAVRIIWGDGRSYPDNAADV